MTHVTVGKEPQIGLSGLWDFWGLQGFIQEILGDGKTSCYAWYPQVTAISKLYLNPEPLNPKPLNP